MVAQSRWLGCLLSTGLLSPCSNCCKKIRQCVTLCCIYRATVRVYYMFERSKIANWKNKYFSFSCNWSRIIIYFWNKKGDVCSILCMYECKLWLFTIHNSFHDRMYRCDKTDLIVNFFTILSVVLTSYFNTRHSADFILHHQKMESYYRMTEDVELLHQSH